MHSRDSLIGHHHYRYKVNAAWGIPQGGLYPVNDCHEMVLSKTGLLYLLTNETQNNILVYHKDGRIKTSWGHTYPGGHGLTINDENGEEFLYITDTQRHQVIKTTLTGKELLVLDYPREIPLYTAAGEYKPTETAVAPNGDIYVTDGYGHQLVIQYDSKGNYIRHWGGKGDGPGQFDCVHGIAIDNRGDEPALLITSRNHNALKRFTMDGEYLSTIHLPGSFICRPVVAGRNVYGAVFRSGDNQNFGSGYVTVIDEYDQVVSTPGGTEPVYTDGVLQPQAKADNTFIHPHDVCVDENENLYIPQWNSGKTYPVMLERA
jgi:DNA-binding beta-propeller fold protein YncE